MITVLLFAAVALWVFRSAWFVDLLAGAALVGVPLALIAGRFDVAATAAALLALSIFRMLREI